MRRLLAVTFSRLAAATLVTVAFAGACLAEDSSTAQPRPIPLTRPEMKQYLEDMKQRTPRIPLPELTAEEKAKLGERGSGYESRLRSLYLPGGDNRGGFFGLGGPTGNQPPGSPPVAGDANRPTRQGGGNSDPAMTLDNRFKVSLFWIVSRTNNCQYCLGHQESKLLNAGMKEDEIAALDSDWSGFTPAEQVAFAFGRRFTLEPHLLNDAEIAKLKEHYTDLQILEMVLSMAGNNSINRWKEGVGVPQSQNGGGFGRRDGAAPLSGSEEHGYLTPTSDRFLNVITRVAPIVVDTKSGEASRQTLFQRPPLESREDVERALAVAMSREPRLPLVDEAKTREVLGDDAPEGPLPQWIRLLANFPIAGKRNVAGIRLAEEKGDLSPLLKAQVSWIIARQDRAWYALGQARKRLIELGQTDEQIDALDGDWQSFTPAEQALFTVARKLAASPVVLTDDDVAAAVELAGPRDVVQLVNYTTNRASFDRITEAAGLRIEP